MASTKNQITLKLLIDTSSNKVVFAEAKKDFVDFLFGLLQVPLGSIMKKLLDNKMDGGGSMARVYKSVADMESSCLLTSVSVCKDLLLWPEMSPSSSSINIPPLLQNFVAPKRKSEQSFGAASCPTFGYESASSSPSFGIPAPKKKSERSLFGASSSTACIFSSASSVLSTFGIPAPSIEEGFVGGMTKYMVMDDLTVQPLSPISAITILNTIGVKDLSSLLEKNVTVDFKKSLELMKAAFVSDTVLTDVFVRNQ